MEIIRTDQLCKSFKGVFRLGPLDLRVAPGEILGVMGPKGAGKTTLLRLLWGFMRPDRGDIAVLGMRPHLDQINVRLRAGYLSESPRVYGAMTPKQFLRFIGNFYDRWDFTRTDALLDEFEVNPGLRVEELSKESRIKLSLIATLGHSPSLLLLDEPVSRLDPLTRLDIFYFLRTLSRDEGVSILLSSNISEDLDQIADTVLMLNNGQAVEYGRPSSLIEKYGLPRMEAIFAQAAGDQHRSKGLV